ncbi:MAG TPA: hypothetical protein VGM62_18055 [Chthoniobacterales bacterium]
MDSEEAKVILSIYRAGVDDDDPHFIPALEQAKRDPELGAWLARQQESFGEVRKTLRSVEVSGQLRDKIVRERPILFSKPKRFLRPWQIAAAIALLGALAGFFLRDFGNQHGLFSQNHFAPSRISEGAPVTITGEVLDMACYIASNLSGPEHADCARTCIKNGLPVGIRAPDGKAYLLVGTNEPLNAQLADYAAKTVTVRGIVRRRDGFLMLDQAVVEKF